jgi:O-antigen ligase
MGAEAITAGEDGLSGVSDRTTRWVFIVLVVYLIVDRMIPDQYVVPIGISIKLPQVVLLLVGLALIAAMSLDARPQLRGLVGVMALLTAVFLLTAPWINALNLTSVESDGAERGLVTAILLGVLFAAGYYIAVSDAQAANRLITWIIGLTVVQAGLALYESFTRIYVSQSWGFLRLGFLQLDPGLERTFGFDGRMGGARPTATAPHPIVMSALAALALVLILAKLPSARDRRTRVLLLALAFPLLGCMFILQTRTGFVILAIGALFGIVLILRRHADLVIRVGLVGLVALVAATAMFPGSARTMLNLFARADQDSSVLARTSDYTVIPQLLEKRPFIGPGFMTRDPEGLFLDNSYLDGLLEFGVVGAILVFGFFIAALIRLLAATRRSDRPADRTTTIAGSVAVVALLVGMTLFDALKFEQFLPTVILLMAMGLARADAAARPHPPPDEGEQLRAADEDTAQVVVGAG